jgi:8-oxo-dGTP diphosphatase
MALPALPLAPGWAAGPIHLVDDPIRWGSGRDAPEVLGLSALWWPPSHGLPAGTRGVVLHGFPTEVGTPPGLPVIAGIDADVLREGELVEVNGSKGTLTIAGVEEIRVVTAILQRDDGRILLLERSSRVGSFQGRWAGVSGFLEDPTPLDQAYREVREEVGLDRPSLRLESEGLPVLARDGGRIFVVYPFRFRALSTELRLDWEHTRAEWVDAGEIRRRATVPKLDRVWEAVRPGGAPKG